MTSLTKSQLIKNISRYNLDSRIGRFLLSIRGTGIRLGERISLKSGYCPEILDYRHYREGDPLKDIDWKISARQEQLLVKIREGYRQTDFTIAIDSSLSMKTTYEPLKKNALPFGPENKVFKGKMTGIENISKYTTGLTMAYIIGRIALGSRDRIYLFFEQERIRIDSQEMLLSILMELEGLQSQWDFWQYQIAEATNAFIISDLFLETAHLETHLEDMNRKCKNIFLFALQDPIEKFFDFFGKFRFMDPEMQKNISFLGDSNFIYAQTEEIRETYIKRYQDHYIEAARLAKLFGARFGKILTDEDPFQAFIKAVS